MKVALISDLHLYEDHHKAVKLIIEDLEENKPDVIINAGDVVTTHGRGTVNAVDLHMRCSDIVGGGRYIYVPGNHDFYDNNVDKPEDYKDIKVTPIGDDTVILSAPLWTNVPPCDYMTAKYSMNDYVYIPGWSVERMNLLHHETVIQLREALTIFRSLKIIVVTHHAPASVCIEERFRGDGLNTSFIAFLDEDIIMNKIDVWCHGHVHHEIDTTFFDTRIICHPRGYKGEENWRDYKPKYFEI